MLYIVGENTVFGCWPPPTVFDNSVLEFCVLHAKQVYTPVEVMLGRICQDDWRRRF